VAIGATACSTNKMSKKGLRTKKEAIVKRAVKILKRIFRRASLL
jgi:hypothetical protein